MIQNSSAHDAIINKVVDALEPALIYQYQNALYIVMQAQGPPAPSLKASLHAATYGMEFPDFYIFGRDEVSSGLSNGILLYQLLFADKNKIYTADKLCLLPSLAQRAEQAQQKALTLMEQGLQRSQSFGKGAQFYAQEKQYETAAFMIHQGIELLCRNLILAVTAQEMKTHCIKEKLERCRMFLPALYLLATDKDTKDISPLVLQLDKAYSCARYSLHYQIEAADIQEALTLLDKMQGMVQAFIMNCSNGQDEQEHDRVDVPSETIKQPIIDAPSVLPITDSYKYSPDYPEWQNQPIILSKMEIENPDLVLAEFFDCFHLHDGREAMHEMLYAALHDKDAEAINFLHLHDLVVKLIEAAWVKLHEDKQVNKKPEVTTMEYQVLPFDDWVAHVEQLDRLYNYSATA